MKRTLIFACLLACASLIVPTSTEAGLFGNSNFRCRFQRVFNNTRGYMSRWRNDDCCCDDAYDATHEDAPTPADGMAPAPAPEDGEPAPPPSDEAAPAAPEPAEDASA